MGHPDLCTPWAADLEDRVGADYFFVEVVGELGSALLGFEVDVGYTEALRETGGPFEVVEEAPEEVAVNGDALGDAALHLREVVAEVHDAIAVEDTAVGTEDVGGGAAVFGDVDFFDAPNLGDEFGGPVEGLRIEEEPVGAGIRVGSGARD